MSYTNNFANTNDTTGRREGFNDTQGGTDSYGTGTGSGAYDPANTGLGGYGGSQTGADTRNQGQGQNRNPSSGNPGFGDSGGQSQDQFDNNDTTTGTGVNAGAGQGFGRSGSGSGARGGYDQGQVNDELDQAHREGQQSQQSRSDAYGGESQRERGGGKPAFGDKMRGNAEKLVGSVAGKGDLKERGEERKAGGFGDQY